MTDNKQKQYPLTKSILARKFIFYILLFSSIITLIGTSFQLFLDYSKDRTNIQNTLAQIETTHLHSIVNNLWVSDRELITVQLQEILSLPDIQYIAISSDGEEKISVGTRKSTKILSQEYPLIYSFRNQEVSLGSLQIEATLDNAFQRLRSRVFIILLTQGIKTFLVSLFIFFVFYLLIGRHLLTMADFARDLNLETIETSIQLDLPERGQPDELDQVVSSLNEMREGLRQSVQELNRHRYHLEELVEERTREINKTQQALIDSEERFHSLSDAAFEGIVITEKGLILEFNNTLCKMMGYQPSELIGKAATDLVPPEERENVKNKILSGYEQPYETTCLRKDGSSFPIEVHAKMFLYKGKQARVTAIRDISERKKAEEALRESEKELRKHRDHLEEEVRIRTDELKKTHEQLLHAEKLSAVGKLSSSIAHEFNNPLQGVSNIIERIKRKVQLNRTDAELVDMAINECDRMKYLIKDLQEFNRPTSGVSSPTDVHATIESILLMTKKDLKEYGISIEKQFAEDMPQIEAVADQLKQVFLNLLNNAIDACENGGGIVIATEVSGKDVAIRFRDTGKGIRPEDITQIFEPFFTTKPAVKGTGLGLSVSYGIIKAHGGSIDVESDVGKGTIFIVTLPMEGVS